MRQLWALAPGHPVRRPGEVFFLWTPLPGAFFLQPLPKLCLGSTFFLQSRALFLLQGFVLAAPMGSGRHLASSAAVMRSGHHLVTSAAGVVSLTFHSRCLLTMSPQARALALLLLLLVMCSGHNLSRRQLSCFCIPFVPHSYFVLTMSPTLVLTLLHQTWLSLFVSMQCSDPQNHPRCPVRR